MALFDKFKDVKNSVMDAATNIADTTKNSINKANT